MVAFVQKSQMRVLNSVVLPWDSGTSLKSSRSETFSEFEPFSPVSHPFFQVMLWNYHHEKIVCKNAPFYVTLVAHRQLGSCYEQFCDRCTHSYSLKISLRLLIKSIIWKSNILKCLHFDFSKLSSASSKVLTGIKYLTGMEMWRARVFVIFSILQFFSVFWLLYSSINHSLYWTSTFSTFLQFQAKVTPKNIELQMLAKLPSNPKFLDLMRTIRCCVFEVVVLRMKKTGEQKCSCFDPCFRN